MILSLQMRKESEVLREKTQGQLLHNFCNQEYNPHASFLSHSRFELGAFHRAWITVGTQEVMIIMILETSSTG